MKKLSNLLFAYCKSKNHLLEFNPLQCLVGVLFRNPIPRIISNVTGDIFKFSFITNDPVMETLLLIKFNS
jgi:hypothetical protein